MDLSKGRPGHQTTASFAIRAAADGGSIVTYTTGRDLLAPHNHPERLEWIRKSYERFLQKVLEKEELVGVPPTDIS